MVNAASFLPQHRAQRAPSECGSLLPLFNVPSCPAIFKYKLETLNSKPQSGSKLPHSKGFASPKTMRH
jgi:hypothetical protein